MTYLLAILNSSFQIFDYELSFIELMGTLFGLLSVYLATKQNILTWGTGLVNEIFLFVLFFQIQLYADMFLQLFFLFTTLYGWYNWKSKTNFVKISQLSLKAKSLIIIGIIAGTLTFGNIFTRIHLVFPDYFKIQAAYPIVDSFVMFSSMIATFLLAKKKIENWYLWIAIDLVCIVLYYKKGVYFLSFEYLIFLVLATYGYFNWNKLLNND